MKKFPLLLSIIISHVITIVAETNLGNDIGGRTFEKSGNPFLVDKDLVIPEKSQVTIKPGCVFLFKPFTGINVYGNITVDGTEEDPVIFSSINDADYNSKAEQLPNSFDWNGIYIAKESSDVKLCNFRLMYSVFGVKSKKEDVIIQNGYFKQNGQFHFTINNNILYVQDNIPYSYNVEPKEDAPSDSQKIKQPVKKAKKKKSRKSRIKNAVGFSLLGVGVASGITSLVSGIQALSNYNEYEKLYGNNATRKESEKHWEKYVELRRVSIISGISCGISLPVSAVVFVFLKDKKPATLKKVTINIGSSSNRIGFGITSRF